jgi:hypothetical protein
MRTAASALVFSVLVLRALGSGDQVWSVVPAAGVARSLEGVVVPGAMSDEVVRTVGSNPAGAPHQVAPRRILAVELPGLSGVRVREPAVAKVSDAPIPADAHWPDAHGRIALVSPAMPGAPGDRGSRNPREAQGARGQTGGETVFACGGIITGGDAGPVAILNGRIVRPGDSLGEYGVAAIQADAVLLERAGAHIVIPRGRSTTVALSDR